MLTARLRVKDPVVLEGASALLEYALDKPDLGSDETFVRFVAKAATEHPNLGVRATAAAALGQLPSDSRHLALALPALDASNTPAALYVLLKRLQLPSEGPIVDGYATAATKLLAHPAPEVRGIAAAKLGRAASRDDAKAIEAVAKLLADDVAYVRCQAARGVGALRAKSALPRLVALLDDDASCALSVDEPNYDGTSRKRPLPFGNDPLAMVAALAIKDVSLSTKDRLSLVRVDPKDKVAVKTLVDTARAWGNKHG